MAAGDPGEHEQRQGIAGGRARGWERQQGAAVGTGRGMGTATMDCMGGFKGGHAEGCGLAEGTGKGMEDGRGDCRRDEHRDQGGDCSLMLLRQGADLTILPLYY